MPTVLFDIDGTLMNSGGAGTRAMARTATQLLGVSGIPPIPVHGRTDFAIFQDLLSALDVEFGAGYEIWRMHYHTWLEQELGATGLVRPRLLPGARDLLNELRSNNWYSALITGNSEQAAGLKLRTVGIEKDFVSGGFGDWSGCRNQVARQAVDACTSSITGFCVTGSVMIGDTIHDVTCGRSVNMLVIGVTTGGSTRIELETAGATLVVDSLTELTIDGLSKLLFRQESTVKR